jgi:hypothetical protein
MTQVATVEQITDGDLFTSEAGILLKEGPLECPNPEDGFCLTDALIEPGEFGYYQSKHPEKATWTLIEEDGVQWFVSGLHFVNRMGYVLTDLRADDPRFDSIREADGSVCIKYWDDEDSREDNIVDL